jgi:uncharacterized phage-associated protein
VLERQHPPNGADTTMARTPLNPEIASELRRLALLSDDQIDTSDIPETVDWSRAVRSRFSRTPVEARGYDVRAIANWVLDYLAEIDRSVSNMSLNKLVYFILERGLIEKRVLFTSARAEAWDHGPVFREVYHAVKGDNSKPISSRIGRYSIIDRGVIEAREQFPPEDADFFASIIEDYKDFSASQLRGISHRKDGPWETVWKSAQPVNPGMVISTGLILASAPKRRDLNGRP